MDLNLKLKLFGCVKKLLLLWPFLIPNILVAQDSNWITFSVEFPDKKGLIDVNLLLRKNAPVTLQPFLVVAAAKMNMGTTEIGQATKSEMPILIAFTDSVVSILKKSGTYSYAGNFTREEVRINYFYVTDTIGLRDKFVSMYARNFPEYNLGLKFKYEENWQTYFEFLYPGDKILEAARKGKSKKKK